MMVYFREKILYLVKYTRFRMSNWFVNTVLDPFYVFRFLPTKRVN